MGPFGAVEVLPVRDVPVPSEAAAYEVEQTRGAAAVVFLLSASYDIGLQGGTRCYNESK